MQPNNHQYPWYSVAVGEELQQGDIIERCPVFRPKGENLDNPHERHYFDWFERDLIVMSQSCDLVKGREKVHDVLMCALWRRTEIKTGPLAAASGLEDARKGRLPAVHLLERCEMDGHSSEVRIVEFHRTYSLPITFLRQRAAKQPHVRLMPPYREHLSQAFARYFMRVGLPTDIGPFV